MLLSSLFVLLTSIFYFYHTISSELWLNIPLSRSVELGLCIQRLSITKDSDGKGLQNHLTNYKSYSTSKAMTMYLNSSFIITI